MTSFKYRETEGITSDTDGYTSSAIMYNFITRIAPDIEIDFNIHPEKEHGIIPDDVDYGYDFVIVPDAGSNQADELEELSRRADVLIIDHHIADVDVNSDRVIVVNNQTSSFFSNKSLSGAGMVYKFVQAYCETYGYGEIYKDYQDLAAIGIVADSMDSRNLDNNYLIYHGLRNIKNPLIKELLNKRAFSVSSVENPNKIDIAFYVAPIINGLIRFGSQEEKFDFFTALAIYDIDETFERMWRGEVKVETFYQKIAREAANVKVKQDNEVNKLLPILQDRIEEEGMHNNKIIICKTSMKDPDEVPKTVTGLVAMKLSVIYNKPVLVLRPTFHGNGDLSYRGSGRASAADGFDSFKDFLDKSGLVEYAAGHNLAFGAGVRAENIEPLIKVANEQLKDVDFGSSTIEVDAHFEYTYPMQTLIQFAEIADVYGNGIPQPKFVFDMTINSHDIKVLGKTQSTMKIEYGGISFMKFRATQELEMLEEQLTSMSKVRVIGRPELNHFNGRTTLQVQIDAIDVVERSVSLF